MLSCLEKRALRYRKDCPTLKQMDEVLYQEALDETGTLLIDFLAEFDKDYITSKEKTVEWKEEGTVDIAKELLRVHGISPGN